MQRLSLLRSFETSDRGRLKIIAALCLAASCQGEIIQYQLRQICTRNRDMDPTGGGKTLSPKMHSQTDNVMTLTAEFSMYNDNFFYFFPFSPLNCCHERKQRKGGGKQGKRKVIKNYLYTTTARPCFNFKIPQVCLNSELNNTITTTCFLSHYYSVMYF